MTDMPDDTERRDSPLARWGRLAAASLVATLAGAYAAGMIVGGTRHDHQGPHSLAFYGEVLAAAMIAAGAVWVAVRNRSVLILPASPRMREAGLMLYLSAGVGLAASIALIWLMGADFGLELFFTDEPLPAEAALILAAMFAAGIALSVRWFLLVDEHERAAHDFGTVTAFYAYLTISAIWWLLARGGLVYAPDGVLIFWLTLAVWIAGWAWRRRS